MNGDDKGNFNAKKVLTRAEVTKVIYTLQKARYKELDNRKIDFNTDAAFSQYVLRTDKDGKQYWELVLTKNGYVYSPDGNGETPSSDQTQGTVIKQVTTRVIDLSDFPLVDGDDTPEWGEDEKGFSDEYKEELKRLANMD
ncbi:MAG: hypothetical protein MJ246_00430 [Clostridia bacterium]|nr:hypothetical protein [Clostridia bacterium]